MRYHALAILQKKLCVFTDDELKEPLSRNMAERFGTSQAIVYSQDRVDAYVFDDGISGVKAEQKVTVLVEPFKFKFYIQDLEALKFELRRAMERYEDTEKNVVIRSNFCESYVSPETAARVYNYLMDHAETLAEKEKAILATEPIPLQDFAYHDEVWGELNLDDKSLN